MLFFLITIAIGIVIVFKNLFTSSINIQTNVKDIVSSEITELDDPKDYVDVAIKNVIVYPNRLLHLIIQFDQEQLFKFDISPICIPIGGSMCLIYCGFGLLQCGVWANGRSWMHYLCCL